MTTGDVTLICLVLVLSGLALNAVCTLVADAVITQSLRDWVITKVVRLHLRGHVLVALPLEAQTCNFCASFWHALWVVPGVTWVVGLPMWWAAVLYLPAIGLTKLFLSTKPHQPIPKEDTAPGHATVASTMAALGVASRPANAVTPTDKDLAERTADRPPWIPYEPAK
jgi:hypothetical protein